MEPEPTTCPVCQGSFAASPGQRYCSKPCRDTAWRRRQRAKPVPNGVLPGRPRQPLTVYACEACGTRSVVADRHCGDCGSSMRRLGPGGRCPGCDTAVAVADLLGEGVMPKGLK